MQKFYAQSFIPNKTDSSKKSVFRYSYFEIFIFCYEHIKRFNISVYNIMWVAVEQGEAELPRGLPYLLFWEILSF